MAVYKVRIGNESHKYFAANVEVAKLKAARSYVQKYPNANLDTAKVLRQYKISVHRE